MTAETIGEIQEARETRGIIEIEVIAETLEIEEIGEIETLEIVETLEVRETREIVETRENVEIQESVETQIHRDLSVPRLSRRSGALRHPMEILRRDGPPLR